MESRCAAARAPYLPLDTWRADSATLFGISFGCFGGAASREVGNLDTGWDCGAYTRVRPTSGICNDVCERLDTNKHFTGQFNCAGWARYASSVGTIEAGFLYRKGYQPRNRPADRLHRTVAGILTS